MPGLTVASPGSPGEAGRFRRADTRFSLAARAGTPARASGTRPSTPWLPGWAQRYGPAAPRLAWGRREDPAPRGRRRGQCSPGAEDRPHRKGGGQGRGGGAGQTSPRGRHRRGEPRLLAGRWSRPRSWRALAPALTLESLGGGRAFGQKGPGWETGLRGQREARRCSGGLRGSGPRSAAVGARRVPAFSRGALGASRAGPL